ncbi:MAG: hypothetical protein ACRCRT_04830, partial [Cetobacterium somerae]
MVGRITIIPQRIGTVSINFKLTETINFKGGNMKKFVVEPEFHNMKISQYLREKGYSGRGIRNVEVYLNGKRTKTTKQV